MTPRGVARRANRIVNAALELIGTYNMLEDQYNIRKRFGDVTLYADSKRKIRSGAFIIELIEILNIMVR